MTSLLVRLLLLLLTLSSVALARHQHRRQQQFKSSDDWEEKRLEQLISDAIRTADNSAECDDGVLDEAVEWTNQVDGRLLTLQHELTAAGWNYLTNLTDYNAQQLSVAQTVFDDWFADMLPVARRYLTALSANPQCNSTVVRLLKRFVYSSTVPVANDPATRKRLNQLVASLEETYSVASVSDHTGREYRLDPELTELMANSRDYDKLLWAWVAWRNATGPRMKTDYADLVGCMNEGARDNGFADVGIAWQVSDFEMEDLEQTVDRLYAAVKPLYQQLHAYVRRKLVAAYPGQDIDTRGPIPAHLLGDMWAQQWGNIFDLVMPYRDTASVNVTAALLKANFTAIDMFRTAEDFYTSLGLEPMTDVFWSKSVLVRPADNTPMTCHGSADDFYTQEDYRIKMCTQITDVDFDVVHHEMGHIEYFMQYRNQPALFRTGANAAFHEAVGDTISLSVVTERHLGTIGLVAESGSATDSTLYKREINFLMKMALNKVAFLPFAYVMDKWRYRVFRGDTPPDAYNIDWWRLRRRYQGLRAPVERRLSDFDPGSKYHIPANVPYTRYFLSFIGQFQFHSALCHLAGHHGPLHTCDIYQSGVAGDRLKSVLSLGASRPWPEAMRLFTEHSEFKVDAMMEYFRPLINWLKKENAGHHVGW